jgi:hypothetical protein
MKIPHYFCNHLFFQSQSCPPLSSELISVLGIYPPQEDSRLYDINVAFHIEAQAVLSYFFRHSVYAAMGFTVLVKGP